MKTKSEFPLIAFTVLAMFFLRLVELKAQHAVLGNAEINTIIKEVPGLPTTTAEAAKRAYGANPLQPDHASMDLFYKPFEDKVNAKITVYQDFAKQKMAPQAGINDEAAYRQQAADMANQSPIIAGMGGFDKVTKMSPEEAKAAALQAATQYQTNPFAANGMQSAGMTALYQKIIADPAFAKRFEKMSYAEKEAELRKYMANDTPAAMTPEQVKAHQETVAAQQSQADRIRNAQEIQMKLVEWQQRLGEIGTAASQQFLGIEQSGRSHEVISEEIGLRYEAIPMVELGEYGHDHDPKQVVMLRKEEAKLHLEQAQQELKQSTAALKALREKYQQFVTEYLDYLRKNSAKIYGGTSAKDMMEGTNTEQPLLGFEASLLGIALELSQKSKELTNHAAYWEANYLQAMKSYNEGN